MTKPAAAKPPAKSRTRRKPAAAEAGLVEATLDELDIAPENAHARAPAHIARLAASIRAYGLKQNLVGYRGEDGRIYVTAGGSRLLALRKLRRNGPVPVRLEPREQATATGLAENVIRAEMPTGARVRAWKRLHAEGASAEQIMKAFSIDRQLYRRTMRLADLPDPILDALDAGELTLDHAAAFTAGRPDEALALFGEIREAGQGFDIHAGAGAVHAIRAALTRQKVRAGSDLAEFVGREAYERKGGTVLEDLFKDDVWFEDGKLLHDLAQSKLAGEAKRLRAEWAWVEHSVAYPGHEDLAAFGRLRPTYEEALTAEEKAELVALSEKVEAEGDDALSEEESARFDALDGGTSRAVWTPEQRQVAGAIVTVGEDGEAEIIGGLVKPEDIARAVELGVMEPDRHMPEPAAVAKAGKDDGVWKQAVIDDVLELRRWALRSELAREPERLLWLLAADLAGRFSRVFDYNWEVRSRDRLVEQGLTVHESLEGGSEDPDLAHVLALPRGEIEAMLGRTLALRLVDQGGFAVAAMPPDLRAWWTPNEVFLKRLSKDQLLAIVREIGAMDLPYGWSGLKKADTAAVLARIFAGDQDGGYGNGPSQAQQNAIDAARTWLPPCLRAEEEAGAESETEEA